MTTTQTIVLELLYEQDETAWLEAMATLAADGRLSELDTVNLAEYLADTAKRDRREVFSRIVVLMTHLLKWEDQPDRRGGSCRGTIREQRRELGQMLESRTLRNHAMAVFGDAFAEARRQAADETELEIAVFPIDNPWELNQVLGEIQE